MCLGLHFMGYPGSARLVVKQMWMHIRYAKEKVKIAGEFQAEEPGFCSVIRGSWNVQQDNSHRWKEVRSEKTAAQQQVRLVVMPLVWGERGFSGDSGALVWWSVVCSFLKETGGEGKKWGPSCRVSHILSPYILLSESIPLILWGPTVIHQHGDFHALSSVAGYR